MTVLTQRRTYAPAMRPNLSVAAATAVRLARMANHLVSLGVPYAVAMSRARAFYNVGRSFYKAVRGKGKPKTSTSKKLIFSSRQGQKVEVVKKRKKSKSKKKSLKKRIIALEKTTGPCSRYITNDKLTFTCRQVDFDGGVNSQRKKYFNFLGLTKTEILAKIASIPFATGNADLSTKKGSVRISTWYHMVVKNAELYNIHMKYVPYVSVDFTSLSPLEVMRNECIDRMPAQTFRAVDAAQAASTTASATPEQFILENGQQHIQCLSFAFDKSPHLYKHLGKGGVKSIILAPGDQIDLYWKKEFVFKPEINESEGAASFWKNQTTGMLLECIGELGHGSNNERVVGYTDWKLDVSLRRKVTYTIDNGIGQKEIVLTSNMTGITPVPTEFQQYGAMNIQQ